MAERLLGEIIKISGPLVVAKGLVGVKMYEVVKVGDLNLVGEVVELRGEEISIQVYEDTTGLKPGELVKAAGEPLSVELGPGLITSIYDGTQRPLDKIKAKSGDFIPRGVQVSPLDKEKEWEFVPLVKQGDKVNEGEIIGEVDETKIVKHRIMIPFGISGTIKKINSGKFKVTDTVAVLKNNKGKDINITLMQKWPVRQLRPYLKKLPPNEMLVTGQRVIDAFFPLAKGGTACIPGPFGSGKTVVQHQLAKWAEAEVIVYIGCGERGNEMTDVLTEFPHLRDARSGEPLIKRTVLIANTSNMPVSAREASIYTGVTIAEYFRDMGYSVALMADSTSRWAEALREMSGRLEEMPGEEGYPAYLAARIAEFYERSGRVVCLGSADSGDKYREGTLTIIGAVSPPGGDLAEPVVQATLRVVKVFWSLESKLAYRRHFPSINWLRSYSLYLDNIKDFLDKKELRDFLTIRRKAMQLLQEEASLEEIVRLVGIEALSDKDKLTLETARSIREDFLHQNAFEPSDTYTSLIKQYVMMKSVMRLHEISLELLKDNRLSYEKIIKHPIREMIAKARYAEMEELTNMEKQIETALYEEL
ncbi:V-type ATP synthase subunit A [bacterium]